MSGRAALARLRQARVSYELATGVGGALVVAVWSDDRTGFLTER